MIALSLNLCKNVNIFFYLYDDIDLARGVQLALFVDSLPRKRLQISDRAGSKEVEGGLTCLRMKAATSVDSQKLEWNR